MELGHLRRARSLVLLSLAFAASGIAGACWASGSGDLNAYVLQAVDEMPGGGTYATNTAAAEGLIAAVKTQPELEVDATHATPSFCTTATYLVFLKALQRLRTDSLFTIAPSLLAPLAPPASVASLYNDDGKGIWGRWNANGPGTARLFHELGLGESFVNWSAKRPGDFMKIQWNEHIGGAKERGHSVVYLGERKNPKTGDPEIQYFSSNQPNGYGKVWISRSRVVLSIFSRFTNPDAVANYGAIPETDPYLSSLLTTESSFAEAKTKSGVTDSE